MPKQRPIRALLLDLEGTLYFKGAPISGAKQALDELREMGFFLRFLTNTDTKSTKTIYDELAEMGLSVKEEEIFSAAGAALQFLSENPDKLCYCLVSRELAPIFTPYQVVNGKVDYVIVGDFRDSLRYDVLNNAFQHIMAGAEIIALQKGRYFIRDNGYNIDTGAFVQALEYASGKTARVLGKPSPEFFHLVLKQISCLPQEVAVVGDDLTTDIAGAKEIGALAVLVRTGKFDPQALTGTEVHPDAVVDSIVDVPGLVKEISSSEKE